ncbi:MULTISPECIES: DUF6611 family protein [unclassified Cryobacterium]|nr:MULTISPECIES: DUF6611 family protein [unclassified Cryobacterium]TFB95836.1 hypothetical protein E3O39_12555 [Cryobacterium sp. MDB2-A-1]
MNSARMDLSELTLSRWLSPLLDGRCRWGSYTVSAGRYGSTSQRLVLYPAGISARQRRRVRVWRGWTVLGLVAVFGEFVTLVEAGAPRLLVITSCIGFYVASTLVVAHAAGSIRRGVLELTVVSSSLAPDTRLSAESRYLAGLASTLLIAEESLACGASSPADHELVWSSAYSDARRHLGAGR